MSKPRCWLIAGHDRSKCTRTAAGGYCAARRCYCGGCPWYQPIEVMATYTPDSFTSFDKAAVASGRRATGIQRQRART